jgi:hypothetical protein|tara:strand:- start:389 stop:880 length:492 start_codon:yes stop_codon:yes gene_type:complete
MKDHKFVTAHFIDEQRMNVQSYWLNEDTSDIIENITEVKKDSAVWNELLTHITIDKIHENTIENIRASDLAFKDLVVDIAKERNLVYDKADIMSADVWKVIAGVFVKFNPEKKEELFFLKMELFENEIIKQCADRELKKDLRKATDFVSAIEVACKMYRLVEG